MDGKMTSRQITRSVMKGRKSWQTAVDKNTSRYYSRINLKSSLCRPVYMLVKGLLRKTLFESGSNSKHKRSDQQVSMVKTSRDTMRIIT